MGEVVEGQVDALAGATFYEPRRPRRPAPCLHRDDVGDGSPGLRQRHGLLGTARRCTVTDHYNRTQAVTLAVCTNTLKGFI